MGEYAGLSEVNPDILCPTTGQICSARQRIVDLYSPNQADTGLQFGDTVEARVGPQLGDALPAEMHPRRDTAKMAVKLAEQSTQARLRGCNGMTEEGECPTRQAMNESQTRVTAVGGLRRLFRKKA